MKKKVLVLESDLFLSGLICEFLEIGGFEAEDVDYFETSWEQALSGRFDLVIIERSWALVSGIYPDRRLSHMLGAPVIITADQSEIDGSYYGRQREARGLLIKPFNFMELMLRVKEAMTPRKFRGFLTAPDGPSGVPGCAPQFFHREVAALMTAENEI